MAQQIKVQATKPNILSPVSRTHSCVLSSKLRNEPTRVSLYTYTLNKYKGGVW